MSILVTYASAKGSTTEIANRIAQRLRTNHPDLTVDCLPVATVTASSLPNYTAIIIGSAVQWFKWLPAASGFITTHASILRSKPVWAFSVGFPAEEAEREQQEEIFDRKLREDVPELKEHKFFWGRWRKTDAGITWRIVLRAIAPQYVKRFGDDRDWEAIEQWADGVATEVTGE